MSIHLSGLGSQGVNCPVASCSDTVLDEDSIEQREVLSTLRNALDSPCLRGNSHRGKTPHARKFGGGQSCPSDRYIAYVVRNGDDVLKITQMRVLD